MQLIPSTLPNGMRVLLIPQPDAPTVTALVLTATGSLTETDMESGISHVLEHMCFKGTLSLPTSKDISTHFDRLGAVSNAFTSQECTGYFAKGNPEYLESFVTVLADIFMNPTIDEAELAKEKGVIVEEINMYEDMPQYKVGDVLMRLMYGDAPAGRSIAGTKETVRAASAEAIRAYRDRQYRADDTVVVVSGSFDPISARTIIEHSFSALPEGTGMPLVEVAKGQDEFRHAFHHKKTDQTHVAIGFRALPQFHPDMPALGILAIILGGGMSSRLFLKLREALGAAYYVRSDIDAFRDFGLFGIASGIDRERFDEILGAIVDEVERLKQAAVPADELAKAKAQAEGALRRGLESSDEIAMYFAGQFLLQKTYKTIEERLAEIAAVTADDVLRVAREHLTGAGASLAVVGDIDESYFAGKGTARLASL